MPNENNISTQETKEVEHLFSIGAHLGHKKNRLHPKARNFVYTIVNGTSVIDLSKTVTGLSKARAYLTEAGKEGKTILLVATKKTASTVASELAKEHDIPFISSKWLPGLLTNFETIMKNVKKLTDLKQERDSGVWETYVKHERTKLNKEINKLEKLYGGLTSLTARPDILAVLDIRKEKNAVNEAHKHNIPVVAVVDTNANPEIVQYPVVSNDDAPPVITYLLTELVKSYDKGKKAKPANN